MNNKGINKSIVNEIIKGFVFIKNKENKAIRIDTDVNILYLLK